MTKTTPKEIENIKRPITVEEIPQDVKGTCLLCPPLTCSIPVEYY